MKVITLPVDNEKGGNKSLNWEVTTDIINKDKWDYLVHTIDFLLF